MTTNRYHLPDPKCRHARRGLVSSGDPHGAYASTQVCARAECIEDAKAWAEATTGQPAQHRPDQPSGQATLFGGESRPEASAR